MEKTNGDIAAEILNQEAIDDENERHKQWRQLVLGAFATELGYRIGEAIVRIESDE